ncbi:glycosyltransferase 61 family protein [Xanthobacter autotrophicus]|uniref:glycosyltransferase family 61 protein n=1 Tax=Xanthobacter autotrophicus TaxID=280 RepID=UPI00372A9C64
MAEKVNISGTKSISEIDTQMTVLRPSATVPFKRDLEYLNGINAPLHEKSNLTFQDVSVGTVKKAFVFKTGLVVTENGYAIKETLEGSLADNGVPTDESGSHYIPLDGLTTLPHSIIAACKFGTFNYSVFLHEILPNIFLSSLSENLAEVPIPMFFPKFFGEEKKSRIEYIISQYVTGGRIFTPQNDVFVAPQVHVFKPGSLTQLPRIKRVMPAMIADLMTGLLWKEAGGSERIYIQREPKSIRCVENYEALRPFLEREGFQSVQLALMPIEDQISLFCRAKLVVAEHGAGLANLWFASGDTKVLEIFPQPLVGRWLYRYISQVKHMPYRALSIDTPEDWVWNRDSIHLPVARVAQELTELVR